MELEFKDDEIAIFLEPEIMEFVMCNFPFSVCV